MSGHWCVMNDSYVNEDVRKGSCPLPPLCSMFVCVDKNRNNRKWDAPILWSFGIASMSTKVPFYPTLVVRTGLWQHINPPYTIILMPTGPSTKGVLSPLYIPYQVKYIHAKRKYRIVHLEYSHWIKISKYLTHKINCTIPFISPPYGKETTLNSKYKTYGQ